MDAPSPARGRSRRRLLRIFALGSVVAIAAITALAGFGVWRIYDHHIVSHAEMSATAVARTLFEQEREVLAGGRAEGAQAIVLDAEGARRLDARVRRQLSPPETLGLQIHDRAGRIAYSTDERRRGAVASDRGLTRALAGHTQSVLRRHVRAADAAGVTRADLDVVDTWIPIRDGQRVIGAFAVTTDVTWSRQELGTILRLSAGVVVGALVVIFGFLFVLMRFATRQVEAAERDLEHMAITDALTGLATRRHVLARAAEECARIPRQHEKGAMKAQLGFIMVDVDEFKAVNDTYGHLVGDAVLRAVANRLRRATRVYDVVGRYGGEEFLVVVPHTNDDDTAAVAERLWQTMRETPITVPGVDAQFAVTISVGYTCASDDDVNLMIRRADEALYQAKRAGRDRVVGL